MHVLQDAGWRWHGEARTQGNNPSASLGGATLYANFCSSCPWANKYQMTNSLMCQREPGSRLFMKPSTWHSKSPKSTGKGHWDRIRSLLSDTRASLVQLTYILQLSIEGLAKTRINNGSISAGSTSIPCWWEQVISSHVLLHHQPQMLNMIPNHICFNLRKALYRPEPHVRLPFIDSGCSEKSKVLNDQHNPHLWNLIQTSCKTSFLRLIPFIQASIRFKKEIIASLNF